MLWPLPFLPCASSRIKERCRQSPQRLHRFAHHLGAHVLCAPAVACNLPKRAVGRACGLARPEQGAASTQRGQPTASERSSWLCSRGRGAARAPARRAQRRRARPEWRSSASVEGPRPRNICARGARGRGKQGRAQPRAPPTSAPARLPFRSIPTPPPKPLARRPPPYSRATPAPPLHHPCTNPSAAPRTPSRAPRCRPAQESCPRSAAPPP